MKKITNALLAGLLAGSVNVTAQTPSQNKPVELGYNALEALGTSQGDARIRGLTNIDVPIGKVKPGFHGLNELTFTSDARTLDTYFGRNVLTLGIGDSKIAPVVILKMDKTGVFDAKYGIRYTNLPVCDYGFLDTGLGRNSGTFDVFCGKEKGRYTMEVFNSTKLPYHGRPGNYMELQPYMRLGKGLSLMARAEIDNKDFRKGRYLFGGVKKF